VDNGPHRSVFSFDLARNGAKPKACDFEFPIFLGSRAPLPIAGDQRRRQTTVHSSVPSSMKTVGSITGRIMMFSFPDLFSSDKGEDDTLPSGEASAIAALNAKRCWSRMLILLRTRRATSGELSSMSLSLTFVSVLQRYPKTFSMSFSGETSTSSS
jgi:hypothetical protein